MDDQRALAEQFERHRSRLRAVATRMLGSTSSADDAVQEAWLRLSRSDPAGIDNLGGWLTTVVARVCLDLLRTRTSRGEAPLEEGSIDGVTSAPAVDPEEQVVLADSVGAAMVVVLDTLSPNERLAFVLHDTFAVPFDEIAGIIGCSPTAARQFASRARRRVQGATATGEADLARRQEIVAAFLEAARGGSFDALLELLAPDVVLRADRVAVEAGATAEVLGARAVAETFAGRARVARPALVDGEAGAVWAQGGQPRVVFDFTIVDGTITAIEILADPARLAALDLVLDA